jgi:hypothetical protein
MPSPERALALDGAYLAIVEEQSFTAGRDPLLAPTRHAHAQVTLDASTGLLPRL